MAPKRAKGRNRRRKKEGKDGESEDPIPSISELVVANAEARFACMLGICVEASKVPSSVAAASASDLLDFYEEEHPSFAFSRFIAIHHKNTLCAVLISKLEEKFKERLAFADEKSSDDSKSSEEGDDKLQQKQHEEFCANLEQVEYDLRITLLQFVLARMKADPFEDRLSMETCLLFVERIDLVREWIQKCREDSKEPLAKVGIQIMWRMSRIPEASSCISKFGGVEAMITQLFSIDERLSILRDESREIKQLLDERQNVAHAMTEVVHADTEDNDSARKESLRGLKQAKLAYMASQEKLKASLARLADAEKAVAVQNEIYTKKEADVNDAEYSLHVCPEGSKRKTFHFGSRAFQNDLGSMQSALVPLRASL